MSKFIIGVDLGGTNIKVAIFNIFINYSVKYSEKVDCISLIQG